MKKTLLAFSFLGIITGNAIAQTATPKTNPASSQQTTAVKEDIKGAFTKKISEFKELLKKDNKDAAMKVYMEMFELMHKAMAVNNEKMAKSSKDDEKASLQRKVTQEQALYGEIKALLGDLTQNKEAILSKLDAYLKTM